MVEIARHLADLLPRSVLERLKGMRARLRRLTLPSLESLPDSPDLFRVYRGLQAHPELERRPGGWAYRGNFYPDYLTAGGASGAIFREALKWCRGEGIDVGAGHWPLPGAMPVDSKRGPGAGRSVSDFSDNSLDFVFSSHCLEHIQDWRPALDEWASRVRPGGILFLYLPHPDCAMWHPGSPFVGDGHKWVPTPGIVKLALSELGYRVVSSDDGPDAMQSFFVIATKPEGERPLPAS